MALLSHPSPEGWSQHDDTETRSHPKPTGWEQSKAAVSSYTHPTLSAVTATEITATSFQPRVTYQF
jgi:hypothetical protein